MRKLIMIWFLGSLIVTAGLAYVHFSRPAPAQLAIPERGFHTQSVDKGATTSGATRDVEMQPGDRGEPASNRGEQLALVFSIGSSIISAIAALAQTWLTHRAFRANR